jgi:hypothetical protein
MIQQVSATEFKLTKGAHQMAIKRNEDGSWSMTTHNPSTHAWRGHLGSQKRFETLSDVEKHYKSWRGISALVTASVAVSNSPSTVQEAQ